MKHAAVKTVFLLTAITQVDPANARGQRLDGSKVH